MLNNKILNKHIHILSIRLPHMYLVKNKGTCQLRRQFKHELSCRNPLLACFPFLKQHLC